VAQEVKHASNIFSSISPKPLYTKTFMVVHKISALALQYFQQSSPSSIERIEQSVAASTASLMLLIRLCCAEDILVRVIVWVGFWQRNGVGTFWVLKI